MLDALEPVPAALIVLDGDHERGVDVALSRGLGVVFCTTCPGALIRAVPRLEWSFMDWRCPATGRVSHASGSVCLLMRGGVGERLNPLRTFVGSLEIEDSDLNQTVRHLD